MSQKSSPPASPVYARNVASALERYLEKAGTGVHWVVASDDPSIFKAPKAIWPEGDFELGIHVADGPNEGSRIKVMLEISVNPTVHQTVLHIKTLSCLNKAFSEAALVYDFVSKLNLDEFREKPMARKPARPTAAESTTSVV